MIQARPFRKINPDADYCNAIYDFMKQRTINHMTDSTFYSADAKFKVSVGEPDFPLAPEVKKKVVVGVNESFRTADHDFSEVSLIPDTIFVQDIPKP